jgi:hypothetical protein
MPAGSGKLCRASQYCASVSGFMVSTYDHSSSTYAAPPIRGIIHQRFSAGGQALKVLPPWTGFNSNRSLTTGMYKEMQAYCRRSAGSVTIEPGCLQHISAKRGPYTGDIICGYQRCSACLEAPTEEVLHVARPALYAIPCDELMIDMAR